MSRGRSDRRRVLAALAVVALVGLAGCSGEVEPPDVNVSAPDVEVPDNPIYDPDDPDRDGLDTSRERELGTNPEVADTDGDRLPDGWEYRNETGDGARLPGADPLHMDLYLQVSYAQGVDRLTGTERRNLRGIWAGMNLSNPDGESGVALHLDDEAPRGGRTNVSRTFTRIPDDYVDEQYQRLVPGSRQCVYHGTVLVDVDVDATDVAGRGNTPGYASLATGRRGGEFARAETWSSYNWRVRTLTHELLHNVAGNVTYGTDRAHTESGWLAYVEQPRSESAFADRYERLAEETKTQLSDGFTTVDYHPACEEIPFGDVRPVRGR